MASIARTEHTHVIPRRLSTRQTDLSRDQKASTAPPKPQKCKESSAPSYTVISTPYGTAIHVFLTYSNALSFSGTNAPLALRPNCFADHHSTRARKVTEQQAATRDEAPSYFVRSRPSWSIPGRTWEQVRGSGFHSFDTHACRDRIRGTCWPCARPTPSGELPRQPATTA